MGNEHSAFVWTVGNSEPFVSCTKPFVNFLVANTGTLVVALSLKAWRSGSSGPSLLGVLSWWCKCHLYPSAEHLNSQFVQFLLDVIEDGLPSDTTDQLPDLFINVLLAFNLHIPGRFGASLPWQDTSGLDQWGDEEWGCGISLGFDGVVITCAALSASSSTLFLLLSVQILYKTLEGKSAWEPMSNQLTLKSTAAMKCSGFLSIHASWLDQSNCWATGHMYG